MKLVLVLVLAAIVMGGAFYYFREPAAVAAPSAATGTTLASEPPRAPDKPEPHQNTPAAEVHKVTSSSDPFEFVRALAKSAYDGDGRAQFLIGRELDKCEMTLSFLRKREGDPETILWSLSDNWSEEMKQRSVAEYRRCARLLKEDPFAELPPRNGGYPFQYWQQRAAQTDYPLAVTQRTLPQLMLPPADGVERPDTPESRKAREELLHDLTKATASGDPDVALTIGMRQSWVEDPAGKTAGSAWMLAACRLGADCGADSKVFPMFMCYDPAHPTCDKDFDVPLSVSYGLSPESYAEAYAQSQVVEEALRSKDPATIQSMLEKMLR